MIKYIIPILIYFSLPADFQRKSVDKNWSETIEFLNKNIKALNTLEKKNIDGEYSVTTHRTVGLLNRYGNTRGRNEEILFNQRKYYTNGRGATHERSIVPLNKLIKARSFRWPEMNLKLEFEEGAVTITYASKSSNWESEKNEISIDFCIKKDTSTPKVCHEYPFDYKDQQFQNIVSAFQRLAKLNRERK